jgi:hypothetical protein
MLVTVWNSCQWSCIMAVLSEVVLNVDRRKGEVPQMIFLLFSHGMT